MTNDQLAKINEARELIGGGDILGAIAALAGPAAGSKDLTDTLFMLKARTKTLARNIQRGTISNEAESIEQNSISSALLDLLHELEAGPEQETPPRPQPEKSYSEWQRDIPLPPEPAPIPFLRRAAPYLLATAAIFGIVFFIKNGLGKADNAPKTIDLTAKMVISPANPDWKLLGTAKITAGKFTSETQPIPAGGGAVIFRNIPGERLGDPLKLLLENLNFSAAVARQTSAVLPKTGGTTFFIDLKTIDFRGKTLRPNGQPAPNVQLEIGDGLAKTVSGADGRFEFSLPEMSQKTIRLVLRRSGKVLLERTVALDPEVFSDIKVPE